MIIIIQYGYQRKGRRIKILSYEDSCCPICGGCLKVHGTCIRKAWMLADDHSDVIQVEYSLRILECTQCGKTHRELPNELVPYKRYSLSLICEEVEEQNYTCDTSTMLRLKLWLNWFICYAQAILNKLALESVYFRTDFTGKSLADKLAHFVRVVVNSGFWITASFGHD